LPGLALAGCLVLCGAARAATDDAATEQAKSSDATATVVPSSNGAALKWRPVRPQKVHDDGQIQPVQHVVPIQPRRAVPPTGNAASGGGDPFVDPFGDAPQRAPKTITPARPLAEGRGEPLSPDALNNDKLLEFPGGAQPSAANGGAARSVRSATPAARSLAAAGRPGEEDINRGPQTPQERAAMERRQTEQRCKSFEELVRTHPLSNLNSSIAPNQKSLPPDCDWSHAAYQARCWSALTYTWTAAALCHKPLYFDEASLERYGHTWRPIFQPFISAGHFFISIPLLPYNMGLEPPGECIYTLGYYRPGSCAPHLLDPFPLSVRGALFEAGAVAGLVFILP